MNLNKLLFIFIFFILFAENYALDDVVVKLIPNNIETDGDLVSFNITIENIPPKESLGIPLTSTNSEEKDGGCQGADIYINYSEDYLAPIGFNWSDKCKDSKIKKYKFENGVFYLSIMLDNAIYDNTLTLGTITFNPIKKGKTTLNITGVVSSECGIRYDDDNEYYVNYGTPSLHTEQYPDTKFYGATVIIKKAGKNTSSANLNEELDESTVLSSSSSSSTIINNITVIANQNIPKVIVKEVNISETEPNITLIINTTEKNGFDYTLLVSIFIGSIFSGIVFGILTKRMMIL